MLPHIGGGDMTCTQYVPVWPEWSAGTLSYLGAPHEGCRRAYAAAVFYLLIRALYVLISDTCCIFAIFVIWLPRL